MKRKAGMAVWVMLVSLFFALVGCGGGGADSGGNNDSGGSYSISGKITDSTGAGLAVVTVALSGASTASVATDSTGNFTFTGLANGTYAITPSKSGSSFTPLSKAVSVNNANLSGQDFAGTVASGSTYTISGNVSDSSSAGMSGTTMTLSGANTGSTVTDSSGNYSFAGLANGSYTVTPAKSGYTFNPSSRAVTVSSANSTSQDFAGSSTGAGGVTSLTVKVVNRNKTAISGATVVLGLSNGTMVTSATTDASGTVTFANPPSDATVTAANSYSYSGSTTTNYALNAYYNVNVSSLTIQLYNGADSAKLGTATVNVTNSVGANSWYVYVGNNSSSGYNPQTLDVRQEDLQSDGKASFVAVGYDSNRNPVGYGTALDQTFTDGMSVNINMNQTNFSNLAFTLTNVPTTAKSFEGSVSPQRKGGTQVWPQGARLTGAIPSSVNVPYIPNFGDSFGYGAYLYLDNNNDGTTESQTGLYRVGTTLANQTFDFGQALAAPTNLSISGAGTNTPVFSWSGGDLSADEIQIYVRYSAGSSSSYYNLYAPPSRSSIAFPELPASLAAVRPTSINSLDVRYSDIDFIAGYSNYLTFEDQYNSGTYNLPTEFTMRSASTNYFVASYSISGKVTNSSGAGMSGVAVTLTNSYGYSQGATTTDANGNYTFGGVQSTGTYAGYTVTPSKTGYTFSPSSRSVAVNDANVTGQDFVGN